MKRLVAALSVLCLLAVPSLAWDSKKMNVQINETNYVLGDNTCSTTIIDKTRKLFLTAAHCIDKKRVKQETSPKQDPIEKEVYVDTFVKQHYVDPFTGTEVTKKYRVKILIVDENKDVAILQVTDPDVTFDMEAKLSDDPVYRGDTVYHVGNPKGLEATVSKGIVSHNHRENPMGLRKQFYYQIDFAGAAPGSSGGAVYNESQELIGILVGGYQPGLTFTVPIKRVQEVLEALDV